MKEVVEKSVLLTFDEIRILLYGMGVSEIVGFYMPEKIFSQEEVVAALRHLSEAGFIEAGEEKFIIRKDIKNLLEIVAVPDFTDIWMPSGEEGPAFFLYFSGDNTVVSERFWNKKDTLKFAVFDRETFKKWREDYMYDYRGD